MVPQPRQLKTQCSTISARTPGARLSLTASLECGYNNPEASDDDIASPSEHGGQRSTASTNTLILVETPHDGSGLISVGPRPLMLGTFKVATPNHATSSKSRPSSSTFVPHTPTLPSAPWTFYTPPSSPRSPPSPSPVSDEVETLKAQLAASEARVKLLMKGKLEAISASRRWFVDIQSLQDRQIEWSKEKEDLMAQLISRQEDKATPVVSPPSDDNLTTQSAEQLRIPKIIATPPDDSDDHPGPEVNKTHSKTSKRRPRTSTGGETTFEDLSPASGRLSLPTRRARSWSRQRKKAINSPPIVQNATRPFPISPWASTPSRRALLDALGLPCLPGSLPDLAAPQPTRSVSPPPPAQPDLNDLVSQPVGKDIRPRSPECRVFHDRSKLPRAHEDGPAGRSHPTNPATGLEHPASRIHAPISTRRPRNAPSESPNWSASHQAETQLGHLRRFASKTAAVESRGGGPSALRMFTPSSSPREEAGDPKPQKKSRLRKLLNKGRSLISCIV